MSKSSSFSSRYLSMHQYNNSVQAISSMMPEQEEKEDKASENQFEINPDFILNELSSRITVPPNPQPGFTLPSQAPIYHNVWPSHAYKDVKQHPESPNQSFFINQEADDEPKFTFVRMGDSSIQNMVNYGRTPELPPRTRIRPSTQMSEKYPHYHERPTRINSRHPHKPEIKVLKSRHREDNEYFSWKYFGNTNDVCGCYTAKIPLGMKEIASTKPISKLPNGTNKLQKVAKRNQPQKRQNQKYRNKKQHLYDTAISTQESEIELREIVESKTENHEFDKFLDGETDSYIEYKGKMIPLKYSNLSKFASGI